MTKKEEQIKTNEPKNLDFDILFKKKFDKKPIVRDAYIAISDEGSSGKSTAAIVLTSICRAIGQAVDLWCADANHRQTLYMFGKRDESGEPLADELQDPSGCGVFNIRTHGEVFINRLSTPAKKIIFDFPADSTDELPKIFKSIEKFLLAFEKTGTRLNFIVPSNNDQKSYQTVLKLKRMFWNINPTVEIRFILIYNNSLMTSFEKTMSAFKNSAEINELRKAGAVVEQSITTELSGKFVTTFDNLIERGSDLFNVVNSSQLQQHDEITLEGFLTEYAELAKKI